jgi:hypothetical protein
MAALKTPHFQENKMLKATQNTLSGFVKTALLSGILASTTSLANDTSQREKIIKDANVMVGILENVTKSKHSRQRASFDSLYLEGQGLVFHVTPHFGAFGAGLNLHFSSVSPMIENAMVMAENGMHAVRAMGMGENAAVEQELVMIDDSALSTSVLPTLPPLPPLPPVQVREFFFDEGREDDSEMRKHIQVYTQKVKAIAKDQRKNIEVLQQKREEFMKAAKNSEARKKAADAMTKVQKVIAETRLKSLAEMEKMRDESKAKQAEKLASLQEDIITAFCDYGTTFRHLPKGSKVNLVFENIASDERRDEVLVFDKSVFEKCGKSTQSAKSVLAKASHYNN